MSRKKLKNRALKIFRRSEYGFCGNGILAVNIQKIWQEQKNEHRFIIEFAKTYAHELLHILLNKIECPITEEEEVIRSMLGEEWNKLIEKAYLVN